MPYILLALGILIGLYGIYRFFLQANTGQIIAFIWTITILTFSTALFFLAISGRLGVALALLIPLVPMGIQWWKHSHDPKEYFTNEIYKKPPDNNMSRKEALEVLGLKEDATEENIQAAYKKLIKKVHPDQEGSAWITTKLNQARDILTGK